ncbi:TPA: RNA pseudouridine synthase [Candidatus Latescibacteria bacterium]|nr:RNA pseudouridine synthase [Candidatus Latescibacterota bacterium]
MSGQQDGADRRIEYHESLEGDADVVQVLSDVSGLSRRRIRDAAQKGAVWWSRGKRTERLRRTGRSIAAGDEVHLYYDSRILETEPTPCELIEDLDAYSVWYKPYSVRSQGSKWGDHCTVYRWSERHLTPERPAFIVHRLDRAASGLMLIAHRKGIATQLAKLFELREMEKRYQAIVQGLVPVRETRTYDAPIDGRDAISHLSSLGVDNERNQSMVEVRIETGRKHQIRRHLSDNGIPVVGDRLYGIGPHTRDLQLVAVGLAFVCPVTGTSRQFTISEKLRPTLDEGKNVAGPA